MDVFGKIAVFFHGVGARMKLSDAEAVPAAPAYGGPGPNDTLGPDPRAHVSELAVPVRVHTASGIEADARQTISVGGVLGESYRDVPGVAGAAAAWWRRGFGEAPDTLTNLAANPELAVPVVGLPEGSRVRPRFFTGNSTEDTAFMTRDGNQLRMILAQLGTSGSDPYANRSTLEEVRHAAGAVTGVQSETRDMVRGWMNTISGGLLGRKDLSYRLSNENEVLAGAGTLKAHNAWLNGGTPATPAEFSRFMDKWIGMSGADFEAEKLPSDVRYELRQLRGPGGEALRRLYLNFYDGVVQEEPRQLGDPVALA